MRFVAHVSELVSIFEPGLSTVTLHRDPSADVVAEAKRAVEQVGFRRLFAVSTASAEDTIRAELAELPALAADVCYLAELLTDLIGCRSVGVRLARLDSAMCPRFHVDQVVLRVVATYRGPGTEFVSAEHVDRSRLGHASGGSSDETSGLLLAPGCIRKATAHDVVLLKGEGWPENEGRGSVHRSPAVDPNAPRLILTLDPL